MNIRCTNLIDRRGRDIHRDRRRNPAHPIQVIILHQTTGRTFLDEQNQEWLEGRRAHRVDQISAHFVILQNGMIYYTHDFSQYRAGSAARGHGVDIEFAGNFPYDRTPDPSRRVPVAMIRAGRNLVTALVEQTGSITHIHPHGQVQGEMREDGAECGGRGSSYPCGSLGNCPGPDIWVNVGEWACVAKPQGLGMISDPPLAGLGLAMRSIDPQQTNAAYRQDLSTTP